MSWWDTITTFPATNNEIPDMMNINSMKIQKLIALKNMHPPKPVLIYRDNWVQTTQRPPIRRENLALGQGTKKIQREQTPHHSTARRIQRQNNLQFPVLNISDIESLKKTTQEKCCIDAGCESNSKQQSEQRRGSTAKRSPIIKFPNVHTKSVMARKTSVTTENTICLPQLSSTGEKPRRKTVRFAKEPKEKLIKR